MVSELGHPVIITNFDYHSNLISFLNEFVELKSLTLTLGLDNIGKCIRAGEIEFLKLISALTACNNRILAFPELGHANQIYGVTDLKIDAGTNALIDFLKSTNRLKDVDLLNKEILRIKSEEVIKLLNSGDESWKNMVPQSVIGILDNNKIYYQNKRAILHFNLILTSV